MASTRTCDTCGKDKPLSGGKTCRDGHFTCKNCAYGHEHCKLCGHTLSAEREPRRLTRWLDATKAT